MSTQPYERRTAAPTLRRTVTEIFPTAEEDACSERQAELAVEEVVPRGPYSLSLSARGASDLCRRWRGGALIALFELGGRLETATARQLSNGAVVLQAAGDHALDLLRFELALDYDHSPFLERFGGDPLLGPSTRALRGLRPLRLATVAHALLRALCGQLITVHEARAIEARVIRRVSRRDPVSGLYAPPTQAQLAALAPAELCQLGLAPRRSAALVRLCRTLDLERLRRLPPDSVFARLQRERTIGPWSLGVIGLQGLGAYSRGLAGDLQLMKLYSVLEGHWVSEAETGVLLGRFGEWAGLASVYLLRGSGRGLVPLRRGVRDIGTNARAVRSRSRPAVVSPVSSAAPVPAD